jgi:hypothetical protein
MRAQDLDAQLKQTEHLKLKSEETHNAITTMYSAIRNCEECMDSRRHPQLGDGSVGISLVSAEIKTEGPQRTVIKIKSLAPEGPAAMTGLLEVGDVLLQVDEQDVSQMDPKAVKHLVRGPVGTLVRLRAQRANQTAHLVTLERSSCNDRSAVAGVAGALAGVCNAASAYNAANAIPRSHPSELSAPEMAREGVEKVNAVHTRFKEVVEHANVAREAVHSKHLALQADVERLANSNRMAEVKCAALQHELHRMLHNAELQNREANAASAACVARLEQVLTVICANVRSCLAC